MRALRRQTQPPPPLVVLLAAGALFAAAAPETASSAVLAVPVAAEVAFAPMLRGVVADTEPPSVPQGMAFSAKTQTTVSLVWRASRDDVAVVAYRLFRDGRRVASVVTPGYVYRGLRCSTRYTFALEAVDAAGNVSNRAEATGSITTRPCAAKRAKPAQPPAAEPKPRTLVPLAVAPRKANLWVDATGGSCVRTSARSGYADARACSWNAAYQAARTGDVILVRGGSYGDVTIGPNNASLRRPGVTFRTVPREPVRIRDFENGFYNGKRGGSNITVVGPLTARTFRSDQTDNVVVDRWKIDCNGCVGVQVFHLEENDNVVVRNSEIEDNTDNSLIWISGSNISFENNRIHDAGLRPDSGAHTECLYAWEVTRLTLRRNHFYNCAVMDVFITGSSVANGGLVENNVFEKPWESTGVVSNSAYAFQFRNGGDPSPDPNDWDFRYNTFVGPLNIDTSENRVGPGGMRVVGNAFLSGAPCGQPNTTYAYNAFVSRGCGTNSIVRSLSTYLAGFTSTRSPGDYSLRAGSVLRDRGDRSSSPRADRSGRKRPVGAAPDIGAYEFR